MIQDIIECPDYVYYNYYYKTTLPEIESVKNELAKTEKELANIENSWSYRIGRIITWIPRKIKDLFRKK